MRIIIENGIDGYHNVYLDIQDWFAEKERITRKSADVLKQTELAILLGLQGRTCWVPKSLFTVHSIPEGLGKWQ